MFLNRQIFVATVFILSCGCLSTHIFAQSDEAKQEAANDLDFFQLGMDAEQNRQYREAIEYYEKALPQFNDHAVILYRIGICYFSLRELDSSTAKLVDALKLTNGLNRDEKSDAIKVLDQIFDSAIPDELVDLVEEAEDRILASSRLVNENGDKRNAIKANVLKAVELLNIVRGRSAKNSMVLRRLTVCFELLNDEKKAAEHYSAYLELYDDRPYRPLDFRELRQRMFELNAKLASTVDQDADNLRFDADEEQILIFQKAKKSQEAKEFDAAIDLYLQLDSVISDSALIKLKLGQCCRALGRSEEATKYYRQAGLLGDEPISTIAESELRDSLVGLLNPSATKEFEPFRKKLVALQKTDESERTVRQLGAMNAIREISELIKEHPKYLDAYELMVDFAELGGDLSIATENLERLVDLGREIGLGERMIEAYETRLFLKRLQFQGQLIREGQQFLRESKGRHAESKFLEARKFGELVGDNEQEFKNAQELARLQSSQPWEPRNGEFPLNIECFHEDNTKTGYISSKGSDFDWIGTKEILGLKIDSDNGFPEFEISLKASLRGKGETGWVKAKSGVKGMHHTRDGIFFGEINPRPAQVLQAFALKLEGNFATEYDIWYKAKLSNGKETEWCSNGAWCGDKASGIKSIKIVITRQP